MDKASIRLFNNDGNEVAMPSIDKELNSEDTKLISESIDKALLNDEVKTLLLPEHQDIALKNYIIDFTNHPVVSRVQRTALHSIISKDGDIQIYFYTQKKGLYSLGFGDKYKLERILPILKQYIFEDKIAIYKDFRIGEEVHEVKSKDITKIRINL